MGCQIEIPPQKNTSTDGGWSCPKMGLPSKLNHSRIETTRNPSRLGDTVPYFQKPSDGTVRETHAIVKACVEVLNIVAKSPDLPLGPNPCHKRA